MSTFQTVEWPEIWGDKNLPTELISVTITSTDISNGYMDLYAVAKNAENNQVLAAINFGRGNAALKVDVYGGNSEDDFTGNIYINTVGTGKINSIYGGAYGKDVTGDIWFSANSMNVVGSIYGGGQYTRSGGKVTGNVNLFLENTSANTVFGGSQQAVVTGAVAITITGGSSSINTVYGGGYGVRSSVDSTNITIASGVSVNTVYGGGADMGTVTNDTKVLVDGAYVVNVYGGGNRGRVGGTAYTVLNQGSTVVNLYGGGVGLSGKTNVSVTGSTVTNLYGGGLGGDVEGNIVITVVNSSIATLVGASKVADYGMRSDCVVTGNLTISLTDTTIANAFYAAGFADVEGTVALTIKTTVDMADNFMYLAPIHVGTHTTFAGTNTGYNSKDLQLTLDGGIFKSFLNPGNVVSAANTSTSGTVTVTLKNQAQLLTGIALGGYAAVAGAKIETKATHLILDGGITSANLYAGGRTQDKNWNDVDKAVVVVGSTRIDVISGQYGFVYGGGAGSGSSVTDGSVINVSGGSVNGIFGNSWSSGLLEGGTEINISGGDVAVIRNEDGTYKASADYMVLGGGGYTGYYSAGEVKGGTAINIFGGNVGNVFGGGYSKVEGGTAITVSGGTIWGVLYAGGRPDAATAGLQGNATVTFKGTAQAKSIVSGGNVGRDLEAGTSTFVFDGYTAEFEGDIRDFDFVTIQGQSEVIVVKAQDVSLQDAQYVFVLNTENNANTAAMLTYSTDKATFGSIDLRVDASQSSGQYKLVNADALYTDTVFTVNGTAVGLKLNETVFAGDKAYTLSLTGKELSLSFISYEPPTKETVRVNTEFSTYSDQEIFQYDGKIYQKGVNAFDSLTDAVASEETTTVQVDSSSAVDALAINHSLKLTGTISNVAAITVAATATWGNEAELQTGTGLTVNYAAAATLGGAISGEGIMTINAFATDQNFDVALTADLADFTGTFKLKAKDFRAIGKALKLDAASIITGTLSADDAENFGNIANVSVTGTFTNKGGKVNKISGDTRTIVLNGGSVDLIDLAHATDAVAINYDQTNPANGLAKAILGSGNDSVTIASGMVGSFQAAMDGNTVLETGAGDDTVTFTGGGMLGAIDMGVGSDTVIIDAADGKSALINGDLLNVEELNVKNGTLSLAGTGDGSTVAKITGTGAIDLSNKLTWEAGTAAVDLTAKVSGTAAFAINTTNSAKLNGNAAKLDNSTIGGQLIAGGNVTLDNVEVGPVSGDTVGHHAFVGVNNTGVDATGDVTITLNNVKIHGHYVGGISNYSGNSGNVDGKITTIFNSGVIDQDLRAGNSVVASSNADTGVKGIDVTIGADAEVKGNLLAGGQYTNVFGDVKMVVDGGTIGKGIQGGTYADSKVDGNIELTVKNGAKVGLDIHGGAASRSVVTGSTTVNISGAETIVNGSVYGGGYQGDPTQEKKSTVQGNVTVTVSLATIGGSVVGTKAGTIVGGDIAVTVNSGTVKQAVIGTIGNCGAVTVSLNDSKISGDAANHNFNSVIGAQSGNAEITVKSVTVALDNTVLAAKDGSNTKLMGVYANTPGKVTVSGDVNVSLANGSAARDVFAAGYSYGAIAITGGVNLTIANSTVRTAVLLGSASDEGSIAIGGSSKLSITDSTVTSAIYGSSNYGSITAKAVELEVKNSAIGALYGLYEGNTVDSLKITVAGGSVMTNVMAGLKGIDNNQLATVNGQVTMSVSDTTVGGVVTAGLLKAESVVITVGAADVATKVGYVTGSTGSVITGDTTINIVNTTVSGTGANGANAESTVVGIHAVGDLENQRIFGNVIMTITDSSIATTAQSDSESILLVGANHANLKTGNVSLNMDSISGKILGVKATNGALVEMGKIDIAMSGEAYGVFGTWADNNSQVTAGNITLSLTDATLGQIIGAGSGSGFVTAEDVAVTLDNATATGSVSAASGANTTVGSVTLTVKNSSVASAYGTRNGATADSVDMTLTDVTVSGNVYGNHGTVKNSVTMNLTGTTVAERILGTNGNAGDVTINLTNVKTGSIAAGKAGTSGVLGAQADAKEVTTGKIAINVTGEGSEVGFFSSQRDAVVAASASNGGNLTVDSISVSFADQAKAVGRVDNTTSGAGKLQGASSGPNATVTVTNGISYQILSGASVGSIYAAGHSAGSGAKTVVNAGTATHAINILVDSASTTSILAMGGAEGGGNITVNGSAYVKLLNSSATTLFGAWASGAGTAITGGDLTFDVINSTISGDILVGAAYNLATITLGNVVVTLSEGSSVAGNIDASGVTATKTTLVLNGVKENKLAGSVTEFGVINVNSDVTASGIWSDNGIAIAEGRTLTYDQSGKDVDWSNTVTYAAGAKLTMLAANAYLNGSDIVLDDSVFTGRLYLGNQTKSELNGDQTVILNNVTVSGGIAGGNAFAEHIDNVNTGDINLTLNGGSVTGTIYGAGVYNNSMVGDVNLTLNGTEVIGSVYGGMQMEDTFHNDPTEKPTWSELKGNINVTLAGATHITGDVRVGHTASGAIADGSRPMVDGNVSLTIADTVQIDGHVLLRGGANCSVTGVVGLTMTGGSVTGGIVGGANSAEASLAVGGVDMNITGGSVHGLASAYYPDPFKNQLFSVIGAYGSTNGDVKLTFGGNAQIDGDVMAGSMFQTATVNGNIDVVINGGTFGTTDRAATIYASAGTVTGISTLSVNSAGFTAGVSGFDVVNVNADANAKAAWDQVGTVNVNADKKLTLNSNATANLINIGANASVEASSGVVSGTITYGDNATFKLMNGATYTVAANQAVNGSTSTANLIIDGAGSTYTAKSNKASRTYFGNVEVSNGGTLEYDFSGYGGINPVFTAKSFTIDATSKLILKGSWLEGATFNGVLTLDNLTLALQGGSYSRINFGNAMNAELIVNSSAETTGVMYWGGNKLTLSDGAVWNVNNVAASGTEISFGNATAGMIISGTGKMQINEGAAVSLTKFADVINLANFAGTGTLSMAEGDDVVNVTANQTWSGTLAFSTDGNDQLVLADDVTLTVTGTLSGNYDVVFGANSKLIYNNVVYTAGSFGENGEMSVGSGLIAKNMTYTHKSQSQLGQIVYAQARTAAIAFVVDGGEVSGNTIRLTEKVYGACGYVVYHGNGTSKDTTFAMTDVSFSNNWIGDVNPASDTNGVYGGSLYITSMASTSLTNVLFSGNTTDSTEGNTQVQGGALSINDGGSVVFENTRFVGNTAKSNIVVYGGALCMYDGSSLTMNGGEFTNNAVTATNAWGVGYNEMGGALFLRSTKNNAAVFTDVSFTGNSVSGKGLLNGGAASFIGNDASINSITLNDVLFSNNFVSSVSFKDEEENNIAADARGGAVSLCTVNATFNISKDTVYADNYVENDGVKDDLGGGFLFIGKNNRTNAATATFDVAENATLTIGNGVAGYDSIAGVDNAGLNKTGLGTLAINSSLSGYLGQISVNAGTFAWNNTLDTAFAGNFVLNGGTLEINSSKAVVMNKGISGTGTVLLAAGGALSYSGESFMSLGAGSTVSIANDITLAGTVSGYGRYNRVVYASGDLTVAAFTGAMDITGYNGQAFATGNGGNLVFSNGFSGTVTVNFAQSESQVGAADKQNGAVYASGNLTIENGFSGSISCIADYVTNSGGRQIGGLVSNGALTINGGVSGSIYTEFYGGKEAWGIFSWGDIVINGGIAATASIKGLVTGASSGGYAIGTNRDISISGGIAGELVGKGGTGSGFAVYGKNITIDTISGSLAGEAYNYVMANTQCTAAAIYASGNVGGFDGNALVIAEGAKLSSAVGRSNAMGIYAGGSINLNNAGTISARSEFMMDISHEHIMPESHSNGMYVDDSFGGLAFGILSKGGMNVVNSGEIEAVRWSQYQSEPAGYGYAIASGSYAKDSTLGQYVFTADTTGVIDSVSNSGSIKGSIELGAGNDVLVNSGTIAGNIGMGAGDDAVTLNGGVVNGNIDMGEGNDTLTMNATSQINGIIANVENLSLNAMTSSDNYGVITVNGDLAVNSFSLDVRAQKATDMKLAGLVIGDNFSFTGADKTVSVAFNDRLLNFADPGANCLAFVANVKEATFADVTFELRDWKNTIFADVKYGDAAAELFGEGYGWWQLEIQNSTLVLQGYSSDPASAAASLNLAELNLDGIGNDLSLGVATDIDWLLNDKNKNGADGMLNGFLA